MAGTSGLVGYGTTLGYSAVPATTYTTLAEIIDLGEIAKTALVAEIKRYDNATIERIPVGITDGGEYSFTVNYIKAVQTTLDGFVGVQKTWQITLNGGGTITFVGVMKSLGNAIPLDGAMTQKITIAVNGAVTWAAGT